MSNNVQEISNYGNKQLICSLKSKTLTPVKQNQNISSELPYNVNIMHTLCTMAHLSQPDLKQWELFHILSDHVSAMSFLTHEKLSSPFFCNQQKHLVRGLSDIAILFVVNLHGFYVCFLHLKVSGHCKEEVSRNKFFGYSP